MNEFDFYPNVLSHRMYIYLRDNHFENLKTEYVKLDTARKSKRRVSSYVRMLYELKEHIENLIVSETIDLYDILPENPYADMFRMMFGSLNYFWITDRIVLDIKQALRDDHD